REQGVAEIGVSAPLSLDGGAKAGGERDGELGPVHGRKRGDLVEGKVHAAATRVGLGRDARFVEAKRVREQRGPDEPRPPLARHAAVGGIAEDRRAHHRIARQRGTEVGPHGRAASHESIELTRVKALPGWLRYGSAWVGAPSSASRVPMVWV